MNKILLLFLIISYKTKTFIENINEQEYSVICEDKNSSCKNIHILYNECGQLIFNIWFSLDLLLSVSIDFNEYNNIYKILENKINKIKKKLEIIIKTNNKIHTLDNKKLLFYINKIKSHQIIKYNDILLNQIQNCQKTIIKILINSIM